MRLRGHLRSSRHAQSSRTRRATRGHSGGGVALAVQTPPKPAEYEDATSTPSIGSDEDVDGPIGGGSNGMFTNVDPSVRTIVPEANGRRIVKLVYVVLESQYQSSLSTAANQLNNGSNEVCYQLNGYLLEELRDEQNYEKFKQDMAEADVFIGSLIFIEELADKVVDVVSSVRDQLSACLVFPSMPKVMRLNKLGNFSLSQLGQSKSVIGDFMKKQRQKDQGGFEEAMLKLVRTLPKVLKYLPSDKAQDARNFTLSLQYWLGGSPENIQNFLLNLTREYIPDMSELSTEISDPVVFPEVGIWHPTAPQFYEDIKEYLRWYNSRTDIAFKEDAPIVGLVLQRSHLVTGDEGHYSALVMELEARGAKVVPVFSGGLDFSPPVERYFFDPVTKGNLVDCVVSLTGFALVGGPARQDHPKAIEALQKLDVPYLVSVPLVFQTTEEWRDSSLGLHPVQVALQVCLPELDGGLEPIIFSGRDSASGKSHSLHDRVHQLGERAVNWANLRKKRNADKKLAITVFSFPPDKGNIGTAAYLDVFGSIHRVLENLRDEGYNVGELPHDSEELIQQVLQDKEASWSSPDMNVAYRMPVSEYTELCSYSEQLHEYWGEPPGELNTDGQNLLIYGKQFGNVFIGVQPTFGYEGDPMRLLFSKSASPHHGFAAYYTFLQHKFGADAVLHFGTHGSLEFMPGKQVGLDDNSYPDTLIGNIPNLYYYAANNPSEATIAKRRGYANTISYLTPPAENAGLYKNLAECKDLISQYQQQKDGSKAAGICDSIVATATECNLDKDINLPEESTKEWNVGERDAIVGQVYQKLMEIESRLLPCGLHVIGCPPTAEEAVATLVNIASIDRADAGVEGLPAIFAETIGRKMEDIYRNNDQGVLEDVALLEEITQTTRNSIQEFVKNYTDPTGRIGSQAFNAVASLVGMNKKQLWGDSLKGTRFENADATKLEKQFNYLAFCLEQVVKDNEVSSMKQALEGKYVPPGPGGDPIRNPSVLPTGKNIHALDPQSIPTSAALQNASIVVERLLKRQAEQNGGSYPESIAVVLWGTDNIKTYGESLAQVMLLVGVRPQPDAIGRVNKLELISLEELGRPRIDTVVSASGVFRDLFLNQMSLLDRAVKLAAEQDEDPELNFVKKHAEQTAEELGCNVREAATRIFSNSSGSYSTNVNLAVENSSWDDESQLQDMYLNRKSFAFDSDSPGAGMEAKREVFENALSSVDVTFQNLDSSEISLTDVSHYFDSDPTKLVEGVRNDNKRPDAYVADTTTANAQVRSLSETVRLDSRTKLLNPKWYEGMLASGYEGVRELQKRLNNTLGWSATSGEVDNFIYDDAMGIFVRDEEMRERLRKMNPNSYRKVCYVLVSFFMRLCRNKRQLNVIADLMRCADACQLLGGGWKRVLGSE